MVNKTEIDELITFAKETESILKNIRPDTINQSDTIQISQNRIDNTFIDLFSKSDSSIITSSLNTMSESLTEKSLVSKNFEKSQSEKRERPEKPSNLDIKKMTDNNLNVVKNEHFDCDMNRSLNELSKTMASDNAVQMDFNTLSEPYEFMKCIDKLIASTLTVDKHLDNIQKTNKEFFEFEKQDLKLNAIKQTLESLATALKTSLLHKKAIIDKSNKDTSKQIQKAIAVLTKQHQNVVKKYKEKNTIYMKNYDKWIEYDKNYQTIENWLEITVNKLNDSKESNLDTEKIQEIIKVKQFFQIFLTGDQ